MTRTFMALITMVATTACIGSPEPLAPCDPRATATSICNLTNPEDLGFLPGRSWLVVSEMASGDGTSHEADAPFQSGALTAIRVADLERRRLYPLEATGTVRSTAGWGDRACPGPPDPAVFAPHGIDVGEGPAGQAALAVVNHADADRMKRTVQILVPEFQKFRQYGELRRQIIFLPNESL